MVQCGGPPQKTEPPRSAGAHEGCVDAISLLSPWLCNSYRAVSDLQARGQRGTAPEQTDLGSNLPAVPAVPLAPWKPQRSDRPAPSTRGGAGSDWGEAVTEENKASFWQLIFEERILCLFLKRC